MMCIILTIITPLKEEVGVYCACQFSWYWNETKVYCGHSSCCLWL